MKKFLLAAIIFCSLFLIGSSSQRGKLIYSMPYETQGQKNWFATKAGTGDCTSWDNACTFRAALDKCTTDLQDNIWLSPEDHDTDNGLDATGTTISEYNIHIYGSGGENELGTRIYNTAGAVTHVLQISGHRIAFSNIRFNQMAQADVDMTLISVTGNRITFNDCQFRSATGAVADIGLLFGNTSRYHTINNVRFDDFQTVAFRTNDVNNSEFKRMKFYRNEIAIDITHGDDDTLEFCNTLFEHNTSAIEIAAGADQVTFISPIFIHNTTNITDGGTYDGLHLMNPVSAHASVAILPADAGITVTGAAGAWAQGDLTQIIAADVITTPFFVLGINVQSSTAANTYKLELFYGEATEDESLGIFEFTDSDKKTTPPPLDIRQMPIPPNSYIGAKIASSSGGADNAVITISYLAL